MVLWLTPQARFLNWFAFYREEKGARASSLRPSRTLSFPTDTIRDKLLINLICTKSLINYHNATAKHTEHNADEYYNLVFIVRSSPIV